MVIRDSIARDNGPGGKTICAGIAEIRGFTVMKAVMLMIGKFEDEVLTVTGTVMLPAFNGGTKFICNSNSFPDRTVLIEAFKLRSLLIGSNSASGCVRLFIIRTVWT